MDKRLEDPWKLLSSGLERYLDLYRKGLKKQANQAVRALVRRLETDFDPSALDAALERFCRELCDKRLWDPLIQRGNYSLPYELNGLVWRYQESCRLRRMPHMRWMYQLYGTLYNPFDPQNQTDTDSILQCAYAHELCDQKTVDLYFRAQLRSLAWGAHHFPDCCLITEQLYTSCVQEAQRILKEHAVSQALIEDFHYFLALYQCYYKFVDGGRKGDFKQICREAGISF